MYRFRAHLLSLTNCARNLLIVKKIRPNLIPSKIIPFGWVDLNYKIKFLICHWTWEISWIWHYLKKSGDKILVVSYSIMVFLTRFELPLGRFEQLHWVTKGFLFLGPCAKNSQFLALYMSLSTLCLRFSLLTFRVNR